jgi:hypothetical protein
LEQYTVVATKLAFNAPWHALILSPGIEWRDRKMLNPLKPKLV